ncbi:LysR family transcriptional regulator [Castellaniella sp. GW247-6E4]|uniref:LysR family transcriptional regulator n=1 Tax=Castellaniella sp. GW247-6E4 TaxID=3140380 RepID=UPI003315488B
MMDFKHIEAFVWVAEVESFRIAAEKLHTTQPAISQRIAALEASLSVRLFERSARGIKLTEKGQELLSHATRILDMRTDMLTAAQRETPIRGLFRLGVAETLVHTWLPELLERLHKRHPALVVELQVDTSHMLRSQLMSHQIDLAMLVGTSQDPREHSLHLWDYSLAWIASPSLRLHGRTVKVGELAAYPIITYPPASIPHHAVKRILQDAGIKEPRLYGSGSLSTIVHMARHGMGPCVIAPAVISEELEQGKLRILRTDGTLPDISFHACWLDTRDSHTARIVARMAQELARQAGTPKSR